MIAAEEPTAIVINGSSGAPCALTIDYGDSARVNNVVNDTSSFPLKLSHTYAKTADVVVRVTGAADGSMPACEGMVDASVHISPAGSKIETITLSTGCPDGWRLAGAVYADKSFMCSPIPDASAPTNLIHCIDGMKYYVKDGQIGCRHPLAPAPQPEKFAKAKTPKGKVSAPGKSKNPSMPLTKTAPAGKAPAKSPAESAAAPRQDKGAKKGSAAAQ